MAGPFWQPLFDLVEYRTSTGIDAFDNATLAFPEAAHTLCSDDTRGNGYPQQSHGYGQCNGYPPASSLLNYSGSFEKSILSAGGATIEVKRDIAITSA